MKGVFLDRKTFNPDIDTQGIASQLTDYREFAMTQAEQVQERIAGVEVVITNKVVISREHMKACPELKLICVAATGTNNVDLEAAEALGIAVCNVANYGTSTVAQHVITLLLMLATNAANYDRDVKRGKWQQSDIFCLLDHPIVELSGKTLGLIGVGNIANSVAQAATGLGMKVVFGERKGATSLRIGRVSFETLVQQSDAISIHCPLNEQTADLFNADTLSAMKPSAFLINCARGGIVNEHDLVAALKQKEIAGAALDVASVEPIREDNPLLSYKGNNLIITPHSAWASAEAMQRLIDDIGVSIESYRQSESYSRVV